MLVALVLSTLTLMAETLPAAAIPSPGATSTTTTTVPAGAESPLAGAAISGFLSDSIVNVIVSTDRGTITIADTTDLTLDYGNQWSGTSSVSFTGSTNHVNSGLGSLHLATPSGVGVAHVSVTALPSEASYIYSPFNGHFYQYVANSGITWKDAQTEALGKTFHGQDGYLATITNDGINDLVGNRIEGATNVWFGAHSIDTPTRSSEIPGGQVNTAGLDVQRTWQWSDGPLAGDPISICSNWDAACDLLPGSTYSSWASGEPNNCCAESDGDGPIPYTGEPAAVTNWGGGIGNWNDLPYDAGNGPSGYLVEYGDRANGATSFPNVVSDTSTVNIIETPAAPTDVSATRGNQSAEVSFTPGSDNGNTITGYEVTTSPGAAVKQCSGSPCTITGLTNGESYTFTVVALSPDGNSSPSAPSNTVVPATVPGVPTAVSVSAGNGSATLSFTAPADNGGSAITSYTVTGSPGGAKTVCPGSPCLVEGLTNGTGYRFTVFATNAVGDSDESPETQPATPVTVPGDPTEVSAVGGDAQATVTFTAPTDNGGSPITGYGVIPSPGGIAVPCDASPCVITKLTNGVSYTFTVVAYNENGPSNESGASNPVTPVTVPGAPVDLQVTRGDESAALEFLPPLSDGGNPIFGYQVSIDGGKTWATLTTTGTTKLTATVTGLTNGTAYDIQVRARNEIGPGAAAEDESVTPARAPDKVTGVTAIRGNGKVTITFAVPADNGSAITGYTVASSPGTVTATCTMNLCTVDGLDNGTEYTFTVVATNDVGDSPVSDASNPMTPAAPPSAPTLQTVTSTDAALVLSFLPPEADGGSPIAGYEVSTDDGETWAPLTVSGSSPKVSSVTKLTNGRTYKVSVRAVNVVGGGEPSNTKLGTPATVPGKPGTVRVTGSGTRATVTWTAPASDGGSAIKSYLVTAAPGGATCRSTTTSCVFPTLAVGVSYTFSVVADNTDETKSGTGVGPAAESRPIRMSDIPGTPRALTATPGDRTLKLTWQKPLSDGGSPITSYEVSVDNGRTWKALSPKARSITVAPVLNGSSYTTKVRAVNSNGKGSPAGPVTARVKAWFSDPVSPAAHKLEIAVPRNPKSYRGPKRQTKATARSANNTIAYPDQRLRGRQLQPGQAINLGGATVFAFDSGRLSAKGQARVRSMAPSLRYVSKVTCEGYADYAGTTSHEQNLSRQRAITVCDTVKRYASQVTTRDIRAYGNRRPVVVGGKASDRAVNRRVVVVIR